MDWDLVPVLGDDVKAHQARDEDGELKDAEERRHEHTAAARANRVLAAILHNQGMHEDADRYAYRAQVLHRQVLQGRGQWGLALGSWFLDLVAGYGYKPVRTVATYVLVVIAFAVAYVVLGGAHGALSWNEALVVSMTALLGRGLFGSVFQPGDPQAAVAAVEGLVGLLIEVAFIAIFARRFFAR